MLGRLLIEPWPEVVGMSAHSTDWAALGLPDHSPFAVLTRIERTPAPMTPKELAAQRNREQARARYHANKTAAAPVPLHSLSKRPRTATEKTIHALRDTP